MNHKNLLLMRHAEATTDRYTHDTERLLTQRGQQQALAAGKTLVQQQLIPEVIYASAAQRTRQTALAVAQTLGIPETQIRFLPELYAASLATLLQTIQGFSDTQQQILLIAHNPGIGYLASYLSGQQGWAFPPAGLMCLGFDLQEWQYLGEGTALRVQWLDSEPS
jgi:phosphohistidine phosphatase